MSVAVVVCFAVGSSAEGLQPEGWDANLKLAEAEDTNPDPKIVEINLEARVASLEIVPGVKTDAWTYNGGVPGPLIRVHRGDRLIVHFSNRLPHSTTVHWHGVQVPIEMDGVPGVSQPPVETGGSFTYDFVVPDAGLFWYHPHVMSAAQVGFGLYGALLVEDPSENLGIPDQLVMVLSDIAIEDKTGELHSPDSGGVLGALFGREGNHVLVNGRIRPTLAVRSGAPQRWRIVNSAKSRYFQLQLDNQQPFQLIGVDGGHLEYSVEKPLIVLAPGERVDVLIAPQVEAGKPLTLINIPFDRGFGSVEYRSSDDLIELTAVFAAACSGRRAPEGHTRHSCALRRGSQAGQHRADYDERTRCDGVRYQRWAVLEGNLDRRVAGRHAALDDHQQGHLGPPDSPSRVFLPGS